MLRSVPLGGGAVGRVGGQAGDDGGFEGGERPGPYVGQRVGAAFGDNGQLVQAVDAVVVGAGAVAGPAPEQGGAQAPPSAAGGACRCSSAEVARTAAAISGAVVWVRAPRYGKRRSVSGPQARA
ncbi:predicted protein [Streptomyces sp. C]|nr:predicted protein [Streptomyces sp. C]